LRTGERGGSRASDPRAPCRSEPSRDARRASGELYGAPQLEPRGCRVRGADRLAHRPASGEGRLPGAPAVALAHVLGRLLDPDQALDQLHERALAEVVGARLEGAP